MGKPLSWFSVVKALYHLGAMTHKELILLTEARDMARSGRARRIRLAAGLSQAEVANAVGCSAFAVSRWERGERRPYGEPGAAYGELLRELIR